MTTTSSAPSTTSGNRGPGGLPQPAFIAAVVVGALVVVLVLALAVLWFVQRDRVLPNTTAAGIELGGLTGDEARAALEPLATGRETDTVTVSFEERTFDLEPTDVGYSVDVDATVQTALARGRDGLPGDIAERIRSYRTTQEIAIVERLDDQALTAWVDGVGDELDRPEVRGEVAADADDLVVEVTASQGLVDVDRPTLREQVADALLQPGSESFTVPAETTPQPIADAELERVAAELEAAIDGPLILRSETAELTLEPRDLVALIDVTETTSDDTVTLALDVTTESVEAVMGEVAPERFAVSPQNASYTANRTPPAGFDPQGNATYRPVAATVNVEGGRIGKEFDAEVAADQLTELVRSGAREAALELVDVEPTLSPERAEELRPTHVIGTFTTYYQAGQTRNQNIQLLADTVDNTLVMPGEQFSINEISGERTCEKGYQPAGTIIRGELVDTCGGGTSQFGTTTFNAAFFAGVQLDDWKAHSWYISRYPMGREATLSYPVLDVKWTNTTDGAILVRASHTSTSVTVTLYGQPLAEAVTASHGSPTAQRDFETENRTTSELFEDQERVVQSGAGGFTVQVQRTVALVGGGTDERTITTVYVPQTRIVERGTRPRPASASAEPESEPDEADEADEADEGD
jgi:vancomycin resistance protein YoaR